MKLKKNKVIVFGGSGFLGSAVVERLKKAGYWVGVFDINPPKMGVSFDEFIEGDIMDLSAVKSGLFGKDIVYNFAGAADLEKSIEEPVRYLSLNIIGNANILQSAVEVGGVQRYIYASSAYALSEKGAFYGASKRASEKVTQIYHKNFGLNYTILRYGSVYGPCADSTNRIYRFVKEALETREIHFPGNGDEEREYIHVDDAADLSVKILEGFGMNQSFILTGTERFNYKEVLEFINEILGGSIKVVFGGGKYKGRYSMTPYEFDPDLGKKLINNPSIDFGQGILQCIKQHQVNIEE